MIISWQISRRIETVVDLQVMEATAVALRAVQQIPVRAEKASTSAVQARKQLMRPKSQLVCRHQDETK